MPKLTLRKTMVVQMDDEAPEMVATLHSFLKRKGHHECRIEAQVDGVERVMETSLDKLDEKDAKRVRAALKIIANFVASEMEREGFARVEVKV